MNLNFSGNGSGNGSDGNNGGGGCIGINGGGPCGACKFLRRKCLPSCIFAPYFGPDQGTNNFAVVHKVFGASNVSKLLQNIPVHKRYDAVSTLSYEAHARLRDPVYGCVGQISALRQQVDSLEAELSYIQGHLAALELTQQQPPPSPQTAVAPPTFSFGDLHSPSTMAWSMPMPAATYDLSSVFELMAQTSWAMQQRAIGPDQHSTAGPSATRPTTSGDDLQTLARELLLRNESLPAPPILSCSNASSTPSFSK